MNDLWRKLKQRWCFLVHDHEPHELIEVRYEIESIKHSLTVTSRICHRCKLIYAPKMVANEHISITREPKTPCSLDAEETGKSSAD